MNKKIYIDIGKCIYCGGKGETNEHVIPFSLGGKIILRRASCEKCRVITQKYENNPLQKNLSEARAFLDYPSRRKKLKNKTFPLKVTLKDGTNTVLLLEKSETFGLVSFLEYPLPAFFIKNNYKKGIKVCGTRLIGFNKNYKYLIEKYGIKSIKPSYTYKGTDFEKMIAKIAYCSVIAGWGPDCFEKCFVLPTILNKKNNVGYWVGCDPNGKIIPLIGKSNSRNVIKLFTWEGARDGKKYIIARLKFFAASDAPEYIVIVGTLKPNGTK